MNKNKIKIRHLQSFDLADVHEIFKGQSIIDGTMSLPFEPLEYTKRRLELSDDTIKLVAVVQDDHGKETVVGFSKMVTYPNSPRHRHVGEIDFMLIHEAWQGKGIGRQLMNALIDLAEKWLQITRLTLFVWTDNDAIHLYHKLGFEIEGTLPEFAFRDGRYIDAHIMGRLVSKRANRFEAMVTQDQLTNGHVKVAQPSF